MFCFLHANHLHVALPFGGERTDLEVSEHKMIETREGIQKIWWGDGIFGVVGARTIRYAKNSIRAYVPNPQIGRAVGKECPAVESKASADEISVVLALSSRLARFRLLCKYSGAY